MNNEHAAALSRLFQLSEYEARLYIVGLAGESLSVSDLATRAHIPRTAVYPPLNALITRGFLSIIPSGRRKTYRSIEPQNLRIVFDKNKNLLDELITQLTPSITESDGEFSVKYFRGAEGVMRANDIFLQQSKTKLWRSFEQPISSIKLVGEISTRKFVEQRVKKNIYMRTIIPHDAARDPKLSAFLARNKEELREVIMISEKTFPFFASIAVADPFIILFNSGTNPFAVLIEHEGIARTVTSIHELIWEQFRL